MAADGSTPHQPKTKFSVYQNPTLSAALTVKSLQPTKSAFLLVFAANSASALALVAIVAREDSIAHLLRQTGFSDNAAYWIVRTLQVLVGLVFTATLTSVARALSWHNALSGARSFKVSPSKKITVKPVSLTNQQLGLMGLKPKPEDAVTSTEVPKKPPKSSHVTSEPLVPIRKLPHSYSPAPSSRVGPEQQSASAGKKMTMSPASPAPAYAVSPGTPWSKSSGRGIMTEEKLEEFLADVDEKMTESATRAASTPPPTIRGFGIVSPGSVASSATTSGATRSTPLRPVRMSPGSHQKYGTSPKKGEGEFPLPMSIFQMIEAYENLGIYPQIERWRDRLRQWFSSVLLNPLLEKIETSHIQVMQAAASLGVSITVNKIGADSLTTPAPVNVSPIDGTKEWQPTFTLDEDGRLHQLRVTLVQARDGSVSQLGQAGAQMVQQNPYVPLIQTCIDSISEHQRLNALMKGELVKGLLPQSSVRADYTVQRVRELAEGTCVKNFEYVENAEVYNKGNKKWTLELPSDSHLLGYLFCAFLDHPKWMLHVEPTSYFSTQSSKNPLFLGCLPPKERFPEKYVAVISSVPSVIHPGACILVIGKQNPPIFTLYWDKKLQFSLQGRTAMWDAILLLCYQIKLGFGGVVRGLHLGSSAFNILPIFESEADS